VKRGEGRGEDPRRGAGVPPSSNRARAPPLSRIDMARIVSMWYLLSQKLANDLYSKETPVGLCEFG
jgi:hypothetical protein